ncbi:MAG TPA: 30S ribosome-binding factor RbfA [Gammaproteobacteria bacterium]|nr:30S ribosome-binding factor RbfA [Gammaproteobacteria bacterium]
MPKDFSRARRVGEQIQRELAVLIQREIKDPRLGMLTVSAVEVSRDLSLAKVFVTVFNEEHDMVQTLDILNHAAGFLRHCLGKNMSLRSVPTLKFIYDASVSKGDRLSSLIDQAVSADREKHQDQDSQDPDQQDQD